MKIIKYTIILLAIAVPLFCSDTNDSGVTYSAQIFNDENFNSFKSALNPDNILSINSGLSGEVKYYLEFDWKRDLFSFKAQDIGFLEEATNSPLTNRLSEVYLSYQFMSSFIDIGKKKITQSVSFLKSPIDFIINNPNDITKNKTYNLQFSEGEYMANIDLFSDFGVLGACYMPEIDFTNNGIEYFSMPQKQQEELRYSIHYSGIDTGLAVSHDNIWQAGANISVTIGDYIEAHAEGAYIENKTRSNLLTNQIMTGWNPLLMKGIYNGLLTNNDVKISNVMELIVGGSFNTETFTVLAEYYFNQSGYNYDEWNQMRKTMKDYRNNYNDNPNGLFNSANLGILMDLMQNNESLNLCQHYGFVRISNPPSEQLVLSATTVMNLQDLSGLEIFSADYTGWNYAELSGGLTLGFGDDYSEFRLFGQDWSINIELKLGI